MNISDGEDGAIVKNYVVGGGADLEELRQELYDTCNRIASKYHLFRGDGKVRIAAIIAVLAGTECPCCAIRKLTNRGRKGKIDAFYGECHSIATNILVEELYDIFSEMGVNVSITTESETEYGRADIVIEVSRNGIILKDRDAVRMFIEVKTGNSFSLSQILRYLFDGRAEKVLAWRIRNRQVICFDYEETKPLMRKFVRSICLRGKRLLDFNGAPDDCECAPESEYFPTDVALEQMFREFVTSVDATLPLVVASVFEHLLPHEEAPSVNGG
jgi:hypothetical protein